MQLNLQGKLFTIVGLNESGKSVLGNHISKQYNTVIFDVLGERDTSIYDTYVPKSKQYPEITKEFDWFINRFKELIYRKNYNMLLIDESSRIFPNRIPLMPNFRNFFDEYRHHKGIGMGFICRRMTQLNTDLVELSHYIFVFNLKGKNDLQYLNSLNSNIGNAPATLLPFHFMVIKPDRSFEICNPVM